MRRFSEQLNQERIFRLYLIARESIENKKLGSFPSMRLLIIKFILSTLVFQIVHASPFEKLKLEPTLFQLQTLKFNSKQNTGILSEYVLREMQNYPGVHGLTLSNLIYYQQGLSRKSQIATTETLEHMVFQGVLQERLNTDEQLLIQGFFIGSNLTKYAKDIDLLEKFLRASLDAKRASWVQLVGVLVNRQAEKMGVLPDKPRPNLDNVLQRASARKDSDAFFHFVLGHYYLDQLRGNQSNPYRRLRLVAAAFEAARNRDPRNRSLFTSITSSYIELHEELQEAGIPQPFEFEELVFRRIILLDPRNPWAHNNLAYLYCQHNVELVEALREARIANHLEKNNPYLMDTLGWALYKNKMLKEAEETLKKAISINPELPDIHFHLATVYYDMKQFKKSIESFKKTTDLDPESSLALNNLAYLYSELGIHLEDGLNLAKRAIEMQPDNSAYLDTMGWLYYKLGNYKKAVEYLKKAAELDPDSAETQYHLSQAYLKIGGTDQSVKYLRKSMKLNSQTGASKVDTNNKNLSYMILMNSIQEARDKYLAMPNVPKSRTNLKVFYDQLIFLAQSIGDLTLVQKFALELQNFPEKDPSIDAKEVLGDHAHGEFHEHDHEVHEKEKSPLASEVVISESKGNLSVSNLDIQRFFPKATDLYLEFGRKSLSFLIAKVLDSEIARESRKDYQWSLDYTSLNDLIQKNIPEKLAIYIGKPNSELKTQIYAVAKIDELKENNILGSLRGLSFAEFAVPLLNEQFQLREVSEGIFHLKGNQFNLFISLKNTYLTVSNSLIAIRNLPYSFEESLESNDGLMKSVQPGKGDQAALIFCGNLSVLNHLKDETVLQLFQNDMQGMKEWLDKVTEYVAVVTLKDSMLEELEIVSFKDAQDIPRFQELLKKKSKVLKDDYLKNSGVALDSEMQVKEDQLEIKTRVNDLDKFLGYFLRFLKDEGQKLLDKQNKNGEEQ